MPVINVGTSPLTSAREWRGVSLVVAARSSGLALTQAEALEAGDLSAFATVDEMVAAAVVYSASLGIGRDEAMALLDRTIAATVPGSADGAPDEHEATADEAAGQGIRAFSAAVQGRARTTTPLVGEDLHEDDLLVPMAFDNQPASVDEDPAAGVDGAGALPDIEVVPLDGSGATGDPVEQDADMQLDADAGDASQTGELPALVAHDPRVQAAIDADPAWRAAFEQSSGELEAWVSRREAGTSRAARRIEDLVAPIVGRERAERVAAASSTGIAAVGERVATVRGRLERSERATLVVAVFAGIILIGLLWLVTSLVGGTSSTSNPTPVAPTVTPSKQAKAPASKSAHPSATKAPAATVAPLLPVAGTHVQVLNAGHRSGIAATTAQKLKSLGYPVTSVGNTHVRYPRSVVLYQPKFRREAQRLAQQLGGTTVDALPPGTGRDALTYVIV